MLLALYINILSRETDIEKYIWLNRRSNYSAKIIRRNNSVLLALFKTFCHEKRILKKFMGKSPPKNNLVDSNFGR